MKKILSIPIGAVRPSPMNPRKTIDKAALKELADNIKQVGLLQPVTVRPVDPLINKDGSTCDYEIVCGERRYRAVKMTGAKEIAAIVREMSDEEAFDAMITENLQRKDVDPIEEALAFSLLRGRGKSTEEIALRFGKTQRFVTDRIRLDSLLPELKKMVSDGTMTLGAALHISKLDKEAQRDFLEHCEDDETITKQDAENFTDRLFMRIDMAPWDEVFAGSCRSICAKCQMNSANAGCLFYEMKSRDARCTDRGRFERKRKDWLMHLIDENANVLVREGKQLEKGKTVVAYQTNPYAEERNKELRALVGEVKAKGYRVVRTDELFMRYSHYRADDPRLEAKLERGEVYRVIELSASYGGLGAQVLHYEFNKASDEASDEAKAMNLVNKYNEIVGKARKKKMEAGCGVLKDIDPETLSENQLTQDESLVLLTFLIKKASYTFRQSRNLHRDDAVFDYAKTHGGEAHKIARDFIREMIIEYSWDESLDECQRIILDAWKPGEVKQAEADIDAEMSGQLEKIAKKLADLGYDTEGKKTVKA